MSEQPGLTVQEAAGQLGIVERRLRRILTRPEYAARTVTAIRQTKSGMRTATVLPSDLLTDIHAYLQSQTSGNNADKADVDTDGAQERRFRQPTRQASGELTTTEKNNLLVQIVSKQDAEILFLRKQVEELTATVRVLSEKSTQTPVESTIQDAPEARTDTLETNAVNHTSEADTSGQSVSGRKAWWRFWEW
jgi:hypothetical protein